MILNIKESRESRCAINTILKKRKWEINKHLWSFNSKELFKFAPKTLPRKTYSHDDGETRQIQCVFLVIWFRQLLLFLIISIQFNVNMRIADTRIFVFVARAVITVEPAVQQFSRETVAFVTFGPSFWRESVYVSSILTFWLFCRTSHSFYRWWGIAQHMDAPTEVTR